MPIPRKAGLQKQFESFSTPLKEYLEHFPKLLDEFPLDVALSYMFSRIELAQNMTIYCGVVKLHKVNPVVARGAVQSLHMTREGFRTHYKNITNVQIERDTQAVAAAAERVRDQILHGKNVKDEKKREALMKALDYSNLLNEQVCSDIGVRPFGSLSGFKGRAKPLDKSTSRWVLKGIGIIGGK